MSFQNRKSSNKVWEKNEWGRKCGSVAQLPRVSEKVQRGERSLGRTIMKLTLRLLGHSLLSWLVRPHRSRIRSLIRSHRAIIRSRRPACCAHLFTRSLAHSLTHFRIHGKESMNESMNWKRQFHIISILSGVGEERNGRARKMTSMRARKIASRQGRMMAGRRARKISKRGSGKASKRARAH